MRRRLFRYGLGSVAAAITLGMVAWWTAPTAHADNCSGMRDCLPGISAFVCVAVALLIVIVLAIVFLPEGILGVEAVEAAEVAPEAISNFLQGINDMLQAGDANGAIQALKTLAQQPGGQALIDAGYQHVTNIIAVQGTSLAPAAGVGLGASPAEFAGLQSLQDILSVFAS